MAGVDGRFSGRTALVTGGASGIGAAVASRLAREGANIVIGDLKPASDGKAGQAFASIQLDVSDPDSVDAAIGAVLAKHGALDIVVHSAGIARTTPFLETSLTDFDDIMRINLRGTFIVGQAAARVMVAAGRGAIVNIGSVSGMIGSGRRAAYGSSKAGMLHLTKVMAVELAQSGVRVNAVSPGPIDTPLVGGFYTEEIKAEWNDRVPMGRFGAPDEVAGAVAFLCSDDASYVTGHVLAADGGFVIAGLRDQA